MPRAFAVLAAALLFTLPARAGTPYTTVDLMDTHLREGADLGAEWTLGNVVPLYEDGRAVKGIFRYQREDGPGHRTLRYLTVDGLGRVLSDVGAGL